MEKKVMKKDEIVEFLLNQMNNGYEVRLRDESEFDPARCCKRCIMIKVEMKNEPEKLVVEINHESWDRVQDCGLISGKVIYSNVPYEYRSELVKKFVGGYFKKDIYEFKFPNEYPNRSAIAVIVKKHVFEKNNSFYGDYVTWEFIKVEKNTRKLKIWEFRKGFERRFNLNELEDEVIYELPTGFQSLIGKFILNGSLGTKPDYEEILQEEV